MKRICKGLIVIFTVSLFTAPTYAADPCKSVFVFMVKLSVVVEGVSAVVQKRIFLKMLKRKRGKSAGVKHLISVRIF